MNLDILNNLSPALIPIGVVAIGVGAIGSIVGWGLDKNNKVKPQIAPLFWLSTIFTVITMMATTAIYTLSLLNQGGIPTPTPIISNQSTPSKIAATAKPGPTNTYTAAPVIQITSTPQHDCPLDILSRADRQDFLPCWYTIAKNDSYAYVAGEIYGNQKFLISLMHFNRKDNGQYKGMIVSEKIFLPSRKTIGDLPLLNKCPTGTSPFSPCTYIVHTLSGESALDISNTIFDTPAYAELIRQSNVDETGKPRNYFFYNEKVVIPKP